jgi:hypothetical protein
MLSCGYHEALDSLIWVGGITIHSRKAFTF